MNQRRILLILGVLIIAAMFSKAVFGFYGTTTPWTVYRHDNERTGFTTDVVPSNASLWTSTLSYNINPPLIANGQVIATDYYNIYVLDETTGVQLWSQGGFNTVTAPTLWGDRVFFGAYNYLYCYNVTSGAKIWDYQASSSAYVGSPLVEDGKVYFGTTDDVVTALNATTKSFLWQFNCTSQVKSTLAIDGDLLFVGSDDGKLRALNVTGALPSLKWTFTTSSSLQTCPSVEDGMVFISSGYTDRSIFAIDETTGQLIWKYQLAGAPTPTAVGYGLVFFGYNNVAYALYANMTAGNYTDPSPAVRVWSTTLGYYISIPTVADNKVFFSAGSSPTTLYALDYATGLPIWQNQWLTGQAGEAAIADGRIFVPVYNAMYCLGNPFPPVTYYYSLTPIPETTFTVQMDINATPSFTMDSSLLTTQHKISFTVQGITGQTCGLNITIPIAMMSGFDPVTSVTIDGGAPVSGPVIVSNATHTSLYFTFVLSPHTVQVTSTSSVPEFPAAALALVLIGSTLFSVIAVKKRYPKR